MAEILRGEVRWAELNPVRGSEQAGKVKISQIRTLTVERIGKKIGRVAPEEIIQVIDGLDEIIGA